MDQNTAQAVSLCIHTVAHHGAPCAVGLADRQIRALQLEAGVAAEKEKRNLEEDGRGEKGAHETDDSVREVVNRGETNDRLASSIDLSISFHPSPSSFSRCLSLLVSPHQVTEHVWPLMPPPVQLLTPP